MTATAAGQRGSRSKSAAATERERLLSLVRSGVLSVADAIEAADASRALGDIKVVGMLRADPRCTADPGNAGDLIDETLWLCGIARQTVVSALGPAARAELARVWADPSAATAPLSDGWPFWPE